MRAFKIEYFKREHPDQSFPAIATVTPGEVEGFRRELCVVQRLPEETAWRELLAHVLSRAEMVPGVSAENEGFDLVATVDALGIKPAAQVYLGWDLDRGEVDRLALTDLARWFEFIWYPSSDDIVIFDASLVWLLVIDHEGHVSHALYRA